MGVFPRRLVALAALVAVLLAALLVAAISGGLVASPAAAAPLGACQPENPTLAPSPVPSPGSGVVLPVRTDPDGTITVTLLVEDPVDAVASDYSYFGMSELAASLGASVTVSFPPGVTDAGVFSHPWPSAPQVVTFGIYLVANGTRTRVPLLLTENLPPSLTGAMDTLIAQELLPALANSSTFALNTIAPTPVGLEATLAMAGGELGAGIGPQSGQVGHDLVLGAFANFNNYPADIGYQNLLPVYVWTTYRTAPGQQLWEGFVVTHNGTYATSQLGNDLACRRTRVGSVLRTGSETTFLVGTFMLETAGSTDTESAPGSFEAQETIVTGVSTAPGGVWTDVPVAEVSQNEQKSGQDQYVYYADQQTDSIALGLDVNGTFVPLMGTEAQDTHAPPPNAENRLVSVGVYDPLGTYHPVVGVRTHFDDYPADEWLLQWAATGPGTQYGNWQADIGAFDPLGNFVPLLGAHYGDQFAGAHYGDQMLITVGPWAAAGEVGAVGGPNVMGDTYQPVLGASYDGEQPLVTWVNSNENDQFAAMGPWSIAAGAVDPLGIYRPVVGASYAPGQTSSAAPVVEDYTAGVFGAQYPDYVPLAEARWSSSQTSASWALHYVGAGGLVPSAAEVVAGPVLPGGNFQPVVAITATPGQPDTYGVGAWAQGQFIPLLSLNWPPPGLP